jgi:hypothetical protein
MFKRFLAASLFLVLSCLGATASTCVISEYAIDLRGGAQIATLTPLTTPQNITVTGTSAQSSALTGDTKMVRLWCDTQSAFEAGANPTASATVSSPLTAGGPEYFSVSAPGTSTKIAFILRP